jgi:ferric reductase like protein
VSVLKPYEKPRGGFLRDTQAFPRSVQGTTSNLSVMSSLPWYIARSAGLVAWALLTASVLWGLALSTKVFGRRPKPSWLLDLHRYLGGLAAVFTVVHIGGVLLDRYVSFNLLSVFVPFASTWRPVAIAWGVVGIYLLAAVELTSLARSRLPRKLWRATHFASFPLFVSATLHALTAGTDAHTWLFEGMMVLAVSAVSGLTAVRISQDVERSQAAPARPVPPGRPVSPGRSALARSAGRPVSARPRIPPELAGRRAAGREPVGSATAR